MTSLKTLHSEDPGLDVTIVIERSPVFLHDANIISRSVYTYPKKLFAILHRHPPRDVTDASRPISHCPEWDAHRADCNFTSCEGCRKRKIPKSEIKAHKATCNFSRCSRCRKTRILKSEYEVHRANCNFKGCSRCGMTKIPISEFEVHVSGCNFKQCSRCGNNRIQKSEMKAHYAICVFQKCSRCNKKRIPKSEFEAHRAGIQPKSACTGPGPHLKSSKGIPTFHSPQ